MKDSGGIQRQIQVSRERKINSQRVENIEIESGEYRDREWKEMQGQSEVIIERGVIKRGFILTEIEAPISYSFQITNGTCKYLPKGAPQNREPSSKSDRDRLNILDMCLFHKKPRRLSQIGHSLSILYKTFSNQKKCQLGQHNKGH